MSVVTDRKCFDCGQTYNEIARNEHRVFYKCACNRYKGVNWDWSTGIIDGVEYELGSAGSWILRCVECGALHFRSRPDRQTWCIACCMKGKESKTELLKWRSMDLASLRES